MPMGDITNEETAAFEGGRLAVGELTLSEMLDDPIVRLMMDRDRVRGSDIRRILSHVRKRRHAAAAAGLGDPC